MVLMEIQHGLKALNGRGETLRQEGIRSLLLGIFDGDKALLNRGREIDKRLARRGALKAVVSSDLPETHRSGR